MRLFKVTRYAAVLTLFGASFAVATPMHYTFQFTTSGELEAGGNSTSFTNQLVTLSLYVPDVTSAPNSFGGYTAALKGMTVTVDINGIGTGTLNLSPADDSFALVIPPPPGPNSAFEETTLDFQIDTTSGAVGLLTSAIGPLSTYNLTIPFMLTGDISLFPSPTTLSTSIGTINLPARFAPGTFTSEVETSPTPEPSSVLMAGIGIILVGLFARRARGCSLS